MKTIKILLPWVCLTLLFAQCKKDEDSSDLTREIVGNYSNGQTGSSKLEITVIKVDDTTVSIDIDGYGGGGVYMSTKMNSLNTFTLNNRSFNELRQFVGNVDVELSGTGVCSNGNITIEIHEKETQTNSPYTVNNYTYTHTATK